MSRHSLSIAIPTKKPVNTADQGTIRRRLKIIGKEHHIYFRPSFNSQQILLTPTTLSSQRNMNPRTVQSILSRLEVPNDLGHVIDGDPA